MVVHTGSIYTRTGDAGWTSLYSGERVEKSGLRVSAYGAADEVQSALGVARASLRHGHIVNYVYDAQIVLIRAMAEIATIGGSPRIDEDDVDEIEQVIDWFCDYLPKGFAFKVPGESMGSASMHLARATVRRCERQLHVLNKEEPLNPQLLAWFNRLSDFCYVFARLEDEYEGDFDGCEPKLTVS